MRLKYFLISLLGNIASLAWFIPPLCVMLHRIRGVDISKGARVFISSNVIIDNRVPHLVKIEDDVWLTSGVVVLAHSYSSRLHQASLNLNEKTSCVYLQKGTFVGVRSIILPGVTLGEGCYVAAGSVVTKSFPSFSMIAGNPARLIRQL